MKKVWKSFEVSYISCTFANISPMPIAVAYINNVGTVRVWHNIKLEGRLLRACS